jgi:hypothetical protein
MDSIEHPYVKPVTAYIEWASKEHRMSNQYDNTNNGALFPAKNLTLHSQGPINVNGSDGKFVVIQSQDSKGNVHMDLYQQVGSLKPYPEEKKGEKSPDLIGDVLALPKAGERDSAFDMTVFGRDKVSKNGQPFISVNLVEKKSNAPVANNQAMQNESPLPDAPAPLSSAFGSKTF